MVSSEHGVDEEAEPVSGDEEEHGQGSLRDVLWQNNLARLCEHEERKEIGIEM